MCWPSFRSVHELIGIGSTWEELIEDIKRYPMDKLVGTDPCLILQLMLFLGDTFESVTPHKCGLPSFITRFVLLQAPYMREDVSFRFKVEAYGVSLTMVGRVIVLEGSLSITCLLRLLTSHVLKDRLRLSIGVCFLRLQARIFRQ